MLDTAHLIVNQQGAVVGTYVDTVMIANIVALFIPLLVNLITKHSASDGLRATVNIAATAILSGAALWQNPSDVPVTWQLAAYTFITSLVASFTAYKAFWKPVGVAGSITAATPNFGLGSPPTLETEDKGVEDLGQVDEDPKE